MSKQGFIRSTQPAPPIPEGEFTLPDPGELNRPVQSRPPVWVWVVILVIALVAFMVLMYRSGARSFTTGSLFLLPVMGMSMFMLMRQRGAGSNTNRPSQINHNRAEYLRKLDEIRDDVHKAAKAQAEEISFHHPDPSEGALVRLVGGPRMWERDPQARNFGHVRMGVGVTRIKTALVPPVKVPPPEHLETVSAIAARDFLLAQNVVHDVSRPLHLFDQPGWCFFGGEGDRPLIQGLLRSLVCQLCVFHGPDHVQLAVVTDDLSSWEWAKWLPHTADEQWVDASGQARLVFADVSAFMARFDADLRGRTRWSPPTEGSPDVGRRLVVVVDYPGASCAPILGGGFGKAGVSVLEATGDRDSALSNIETSFVADESGNLLKADRKADRRW